MQEVGWADTAPLTGTTVGTATCGGASIGSARHFGQGGPAGPTRIRRITEGTGGVVTSGWLIAGTGSAALGVPLTATGTGRPAQAHPGCCCGPCDMTGGVIRPAALGAPLTATGTGRTPQAPPGCCCGPCDRR